ncbi:MAG: DUF502 domain-containing protein [Halobacterium sp.]
MLPEDGPDRERVQRASESVYQRLYDALFAGVAVVVPVLVTLYVLSVALGVFTDLLEPLVLVLEGSGLTPDASELLVEAFGALALLVLTVLVGLAEAFRPGRRVVNYFDRSLKRVPGVGAVYKSFRQMSDVMLESDADNFQSVKLVEFPHSDAYTLGFSTTVTPDPIADAAGYEEMQTLFLPLAPNPVMGGHLTHVPKDRVMDVDMTVEEGMRTVVTMGVAISAMSGDDEGLSKQQLEQLGGQDVAESKTPEESR